MPGKTNDMKIAFIQNGRYYTGFNRITNIANVIQLRNNLVIKKQVAF